MEAFETIAAERRVLADMLEGLSGKQWDTRSLCGSWTVRQVAAHLIMPLRCVASDLDWAHGSGEEVRGPAAALALAMSGRTARLEELSGPGAAAFSGQAF